MNSSGVNRFSAFLASVLALAAPLPARPATPPTNSVAPNGAPAPKSTKASRGLPFHGNVAAVDKVAKRITMEGKKQRAFYVTSETKIQREKQPSKLEALAIGDYVGGYAREAPDGKLELVTLNITPQSGPPKGNGKAGGGVKPSK